MTTRSEPPYTTVEVFVEAYRVELSACTWCGAVVSEATKPNHARWHESLAAQAREANMWTSPLA